MADFTQIGTTIVDLLTRFVESQERIAKAVEAQNAAGQPSPPIETNGPAGVVDPPQVNNGDANSKEKNNISPSGVNLDDREAVKAALDKLNAEYNNRCATKTLADLLVVEENKASGGQQDASTTQGENKPTMVFKIEDVRAKMMALAQAKGTETARAIIAKYNVENLTALPEEHYAAVVQACEEESNA